MKSRLHSIVWSVGKFNGDVEFKSIKSRIWSIDPSLIVYYSVVDGALSEHIRIINGVLRHRPAYRYFCYNISIFILHKLHGTKTITNGDGSVLQWWTMASPADRHFNGEPGRSLVPQQMDTSTVSPADHQCLNGELRHRPAYRYFSYNVSIFILHKLHGTKTITNDGQQSMFTE